MKQLEKYLINFDELKEGDTVWHNRFGEVKISSIDESESEYPITISIVGNFSKDGEFFIGDKYPTIYKSNPFLDLKEEPRMIEVLYGSNWEEREAIRIEGYRAVYWDRNKTFVYATTFWREIQPKEESKQESVFFQLKVGKEYKQEVFELGEETEITNICKKCGVDLVEIKGARFTCNDPMCKGIIISKETLEEWSKNNTNQKEETLTLEQRIDELLEKVDDLKKILIGTTIDNICVPKFTSVNDIPSKDYLKDQIEFKNNK